MVKLKELRQLAEILGERLRDKAPNQQLIARCLESVWPYIYPYGLLSYIKEHEAEPPEETDQLKMQKLLRAVTGSKRKWCSFIIGLCHTYRERHSLKRSRARLANKANKKGAPLSETELDELAEQFRRQALFCVRAIEDAKLELFNASAVVERIKLAKTVRNEANIPRFLRLCPYLNCKKMLENIPAKILEHYKARYENPTERTLAFDALQEYVSVHDELWAAFKKDLLESYGKAVKAPGHLGS